MAVPDPGARTSTTPDHATSFRDRPRRRVLLCTDWWDGAVNGVVASVSTLRDELGARGHEVRVLTLADGMRSGRDGDIYQLASIPASVFYARARIGTPRMHAIQRDLHDWAPDVVHSHSEFSTFTWARRLARDLDAAHVHTYHTIYEDYTHYYSPSRTLGRRMAAGFSRHVLGHTDAVIAPTGKVADLLQGYRVRTPVHVVPTGLDLSRFHPGGVPERADAVALRVRLGIPEGHTVLVSIGRLAREKNLDEALDHLAAAGRDDWTLVIVGDGPHRAQLGERVAALGLQDRVRFVGSVDPTEVVRYYRLGDAFLSASRSETQGLTYIESLACGTPLLCRRDASLTGVLVDGITGWSFTDATSFARGLDRLCSDAAGRARLARAGAAHAHETCGAGTFGRRVAEVYESALLARTPGVLTVR